MLIIDGAVIILNDIFWIIGVVFSKLLSRKDKIGCIKVIGIILHLLYAP